MDIKANPGQHLPVLWPRNNLIWRTVLLSLYRGVSYFWLKRQPKKNSIFMPHFPSTKITDVSTWAAIMDNLMGKIKDIITISGPYIYKKTTFNFFKSFVHFLQYVYFNYFMYLAYFIHSFLVTHDLTLLV